MPEPGVIDPIKLCCFQRSSKHAGAQCPDELVMCCLCFSRFEVADLAEDDGQKVDVCKTCKDYEEREMKRRGLA